MKRSSLPLLIGAVIGTQALFGLGALLPVSPHHDGFQKLLGVSAAHAEEAAAVKYTCPMHHQIISDTPGKCPICGMDLVPMAGGNVTHEHEGMPVISISAETVQKMGVRTDKASKSSFGQGIRATGIVMENERARSDLFSQMEGRVADLKYSAEGDRVKKGELFYTLYSPELASLQNDYLSALSVGMKDIAAAAAKRMKLLGVDEQVLTTLAKTRKASDKVPFYIPADGVLAKLDIRNGSYIKAGDTIGRIQDLSVLWIDANVPEKDVASIKTGDIAKVSFTDNSQSYDAKVDYIYPTINAEARIAKVRLVIGNKDGMLKPASYATVDFVTSASDERLTVPTEAVLRDASGAHVIVTQGEGKFQSRKVQVGAASGGRTEILSGLSEGDEVVTSSQFLIDSESSLQESLQKLDAPATELEKPHAH